MFGSRTSAPKRALPSSFAGVSRRGIERPTRRGADGWSAGISGGRLKRAASCASAPKAIRSEEHTSELQSLMRISYAVFCLKKKNHTCHDCVGDDVLSNNKHSTTHTPYLSIEHNT